MDQPENSSTEMKSCIERVLVVDDEIEFVQSVKRHLKRKGFVIDFALNGNSACMTMLALEEKKRFYDLVITDVVMPRMDGISLLRWIHDTYPGTSVMVVSEFVGIMHLETKIRPELDDIGRKPMTPESMLQLINGISRKRDRWRQSLQNPYLSNLHKGSA